MKRILLSVLLVAAVLCLSAAALAESSGAVFDKSANSVFIGETLQTILTLSGDAANGTVTYRSSDPNRATVDENGVVTGLAKGQVTISATVKGGEKDYRANLTLYVYRKAASIDVKTGKLNALAEQDPLLEGLLTQELQLPVLIVPAGKDCVLQCDVQPANASNRRVVLTSSDPAVLTTRGMKITGVKAGEALLTIANEWSADINVQYHVLVVEPVKKLQVTTPDKAVKVGATMALTATAAPETATLPKATWKSMDERIATVDANGVVTGVKRGNVNIVATALDGSNVRAEFTVRVLQGASEITLNKPEFTIDVGLQQTIRATVLPQNTNNQNVSWASTDENVAKVNKVGKVTAVSVGTCEIVCTSEDDPAVSARATIHVQQPVTRITFTSPTASVYLGQTIQLSWNVEPANATNPGVTLTTSDKRILTVTDDGVVTPLKRGEAYVTATATDGSNKHGRVKVSVLQPVTGVHMETSIAYIDRGETSGVRAVLEPKDASNHNMTWESLNPDVATVSGTKIKADVRGVSYGEATIVGTTEDGGYKTSFNVRIGDWDHAIQLRKVDMDGRGNMLITVRNNSELRVTRVTVELTYYDENGEPLAVNSKNGSNVVNATYRRTLTYGKSSSDSDWNFVNFDKPQNGFGYVQVKVVSFVIDGEYTKHIRKRNQPSREFHLFY